MHIYLRETVYVFTVYSFRPFNSLRGWNPFLVSVSRRIGQRPWFKRYKAMVL